MVQGKIKNVYFIHNFLWSGKKSVNFCYDDITIQITFAPSYHVFLNMNYYNIIS